MEIKKIKLPLTIKRPVLALGTQTKNSVCFAKDNFAYLTPVHQNLSYPEDWLKFEKIVEFFLKKNPRIIAYDLHPDYNSTKYAEKLHATRYTLCPIQHHHAHIASCMLENGLTNQRVIGVAFDGTGLGLDDLLWGAEFLVCDYKNFNRKAHLQEIPLLGAERAILEPWRLAAAWLYRSFNKKFLNLKIKFIKGLDKNDWRVLKSMYLSGLNCPLASSMGRLFDAVASLVLTKYKADFEAQLAVELERIASGHNVTPRLRSGQAMSPLDFARDRRCHKFNIVKKNKEYILDPTPIFREIVAELEMNISKERIAYKFHLTVANMIKRACSALRKEEHINKIVLSGGVFQNKLLLSLSLDLLYKEGFKVFTHKISSCNDSGVSLGQAVIANFRS